MPCIRNYKQVLCTIVQHMREKQFLQFLASNVEKSRTGIPSSSLDQKNWWLKDFCFLLADGDKSVVNC